MVEVTGFELNLEYIHEIQFPYFQAFAGSIVHAKNNILT